jgi:ribosomal protein S18 acetylase RimI-like enzyme
MAIDIKILRGGDEPILGRVAAGAFDHAIDAALTREFLADPRHHIAVAIDDGLVVGFASGVHYLHPDKPPELWINEVGIAPTHRRQGLGRAVLQALLEVGRTLKCSCAWTLTYRDNPAAMALYAASGGTEGADDSGPSEAMLGYTFDLTGGRSGPPSP